MGGPLLQLITGGIDVLLTAEYISPLGKLILAAEGGALKGLWIEGQKYFGAGYELVPGEDEALAAARGWLDAYFRGERPPAEELRLAPEGTEFRRAVWELLLEIPYGETSTYGALADELSARRGARCPARAVGGAVGHNPISIVIPCHRVLGAGGSLTGYAGGVERKSWLLRHEASPA